MLVLGDSLLPTHAASTFDETQLPCSPSQLQNTDVAAATLRDLDEHEKSMGEKA
jgi:hypothetical protein